MSRIHVCLYSGHLNQGVGTHMRRGWGYKLSRQSRKRWRPHDMIAKVQKSNHMAGAISNASCDDHVSYKRRVKTLRLLFCKLRVMMWWNWNGCHFVCLWPFSFHGSHLVHLRFQSCSTACQRTRCPCCGWIWDLATWAVDHVSPYKYVRSMFILFFDLILGEKWSPRRPTAALATANSST